MNETPFVLGARFCCPMSLKAKIEAVVYAAEEPVTLAQLAAAFANDVLEEFALGSGSQPAETDDLPAAGAPASDAVLWPEASATSDTENTASLETPPPAPPETDPSLSLEASPAPETETDEKKAARQRERAIREALQGVLQQLIDEYARDDRGIEIREIAGGYRMATKPEYHDAVRGFVKALKPPLKLSLQALETLAVIAYKQPVTAPEVNEIRGVDSGGVLGSLIGRKLITTAGRKQVIGRPILYRTTKEFLLRFGLKDVNELPSMEEFEKMAGELADARTEEEEPAIPSAEVQAPEDSISRDQESPGRDEESQDEDGGRQQGEAEPHAEPAESASESDAAEASAREPESGDPVQP